ncbi:hypothetical protein M8845_18185 [Gelidibacter japonicus]|uniref:hypothetical protein n=1 Tax=Gelidibacter japonicus TaxID=1962232 RepID=UPI002020326E|nr:hypothetical protein [Gelidibacter japonicus]MCL8009359.1 hypothetical protein [Gelidibacter japonicus]
MKIKGLTITAIICIGLFVWINFLDFKFVEWVNGTGAKFEYFIETICLSYLAAYVFYFVNIYLVERNERKTILPFIARNVISIIVNNHSILNCLKNDPKLSLDFYPNKDDYKELLKKVNPKDKAPYYYKNETWTYLFKNRQESTRDLINRIFLSGKHVDEELRRILLEINYSLYLKDDYAFNSENFEKNTLEDYHLVFSNYFDLIRELKNYYDKHLKAYYLTTLPKSLRR